MKENGHHDLELNLRILNQRIAEYEKTIGVFKESESYFRNLVNAAPVAIIMTDRGGKCLFANQYWQRLSGLSLQESIGSGWQKAVHREDVGRMGIWWYGKNRENSGPGTPCRIIAADGRVKNVELKSAPLYDDDGAMIGYIALFAESNFTRFPADDSALESSIQVGRDDTAKPPNLEAQFLE